MACKVLILCGPANSGKTTTLKTVISRRRFRQLGRNVFRVDGKIVCLRTGSPQERSGFCNLEGVRKKIRYLLGLCDRKGGSLVIIPFTIQFDPHINRRCIVLPIEELRRDGFEVTIVYLRRADIGGIVEADALMSELGAERKRSGPTTVDFERQAQELWR